MRALRLLLALVLLSAQHLALSHELWHFGGQDQVPSQEQFCGQHDALATVAGAVDAPVAAMAGQPPSAIAFQTLMLPSATLPGLAPSSRGPPTFL